eukprot:gene26185-34803_t
MGVKDLWQLVSPVGRRVSLESLEGKTLAIDASIWLTQFIKAMRDDDGNLIKNAHILGTLKRILKLLFHKIRPIFVFDGATPVLKLRTIRIRKLIHERNDSNKRITAQKLLLAKLKKHAISQKLNKANSADSGNSNTAFASTFVPLISTSADNTLEEAVNDATSSDIEWEEETGPLPPAKVLDDDGSTRHAKEDENDVSFFLPDNPDELNLDVMSARPVYMRKSLIEDARRKERMKSRAAYLPVAGDPALYSQTQLANFLSTSKLNRKFQEVQMKIDGTSVGQKIAAEGKKKYLLVDRKDLPEFTGKSTADSSRQGGFLLSDDDDDGDYNGMDSEAEALRDIGASSSSAIINSESKKEQEFSSDLISSVEKDEVPCVLFGKEVILDESLEGPTPTAIQSEMTAIKEAPDGLGAEGLEKPATVAKNEDSKIETVSDKHEPTLVADIRSSNQDSMKEEQFYYSSLHIDDSDDEKGQAMADDDDMDNIEWQSDDDAHESMSRTSEPKASLAQYRNDPEEQAKHCTSSVLENTALESIPTRAHPAMISSEVVTRAMNTAANMADWAGRAVRMALRNHVQQTVESAGHGVSYHEATLEDTVESCSGSREAMPLITTDLSNDSPGLVDHVDVGVDSSSQQLSDGGDALRSTLDQLEEEVGDGRRKLSAYMRDSESLTEEMKQDVIQLLQVFSLPYIVAPFEAEAQCAVLEQLGLVHGTVTEDSDIFLFADDVKKEMGLEREDLVALAYFLGSDYCEGVHGVGIVNALEILQAFPMKQSAGGLMDGLRRFKEWLDGYDFTAEINQIEKKSKKNEKNSSSSRPVAKEEEDDVSPDSAAHRLLDFQIKHRTARSKWSVPESFPDALIANAYLQPKANYNTDKFEWSLPQLIHVRNYCRDKLGWSEAQMDALVDPAIKNFSERSVQSRIDSHFMTYRDDQRFAKISSSRLQSAVVQITGKRTSLSLSESESKSKTKATKPSTSRKKKAKEEKELPS